MRTIVLSPWRVCVLPWAPRAGRRIRCAPRWCGATSASPLFKRRRRRASSWATQASRLHAAEHSGRHPAAAGLRDALHHLLHVAELLEQAVHLADRAARALRHAGAARAVHQVRLPSLGGRHREDDRFEVLHAIRVDLRLLQHLGVDARQHLEQPLERAQLLDLLHGRQEVVQVHPLLADLLLQPLGLGLVERRLRLLDEGQDVAHLENAPGHAVRVELLERVRLLADADVLDRLLRDAVDRERGAAAGVAVHLRQDDAGDAERAVEALRDLHRVLPRHAVGDEQDLVRARLFLQSRQLPHHLVVDLEAAGGVDDDDAVAGALGLVHAVPDDAGDVLRVALGVDRDPQLGAQGLELVDGRGAVDVGGYEARRAPFGLELASELCRRGRFPGTLEPDHHYNSRRNRAELEALTPLAEHGGELVVDDLDELLGRRDGLQGADAHRRLLHALQKLARELEVDVGLEEDAPHLAQPLLDVRFGENAAPAQAGERGLEFFAELVEHSL